MKKTVQYGVADYEELVRDNGYFVDKTMYIEKLEQIKNPVFLRPRRFGKSLWCRILECYYNIRQKDDFDRLFGHTYIGKNPTQLRNSFFVLHLDFSVVEPDGPLAEIEKSFNFTCNLKMSTMTGLAGAWFNKQIQCDGKESASATLQKILDYIKKNNLPPLYVIIDEYDNFANQLIIHHKDHLYYELMAEKSFLKNFFKTLKQGRKIGAIANVFVTGVLPITMDDLASGFNIATFITLDTGFENMMGFTQAEADALLDEVYRHYQFDPASRNEVGDLIKNQYNGYHLIRPEGEPLYNSTILMYFLDYFCRNREIPEYLTDMNLKTDILWIRRITGSNPANTEEFVDQLTSENTISYDKNFLISKFNMSQFFEKGFFPISFFYLGMLTKQDDFFMKLPNMNMRKIFVEYFNEIHRIDVSTRYAEIMQGFVNNPNLPALFAGYWEQYVSQLPEAIFQQVNENFYRTTFYELCSRYLSRWFIWNVERSYPKGRTDLEFVGKFHEKFAGMRMVIEFKYYSNTEFRKFKTTIENFQLQEKDTHQIAGYTEGLQQEYPEAEISQFVIYCIGNQGFRVFEIH
ncbi:MAG: AAA family ATPase [Desulfobacteraceae bacterium]|nr:AAA family ATPase [Desulfobacteraceae bacterium]